MKKFIRLLVCSVLGTVSHSDFVSAQSYTPFPVANATWNATDAHLGFYNNDYAYDWRNWVYQIEGDTVIGSLIFHKLYVDTHFYTVTVSGDTVSSGFSYHDYAGAIREDGFKHIYIRIPALIDSLLYNFNLTIGDTTTTMLYSGAVVDGIDSFYVNNHWYKTYEMHETFADGCTNIVLMEGIGTSYGFINGPDCFEGFSMLNCFAENGVHIYGDSTINCDHFIWTTTGNNFSSTQLIIFPNPFSTYTTITLTNYTATFEMHLYNELGKEVPLQYHTLQQGSRTTLTLDRGDLLSGMYFLSVASGEKMEVMKIMVE